MDRIENYYLTNKTKDMEDRPLDQPIDKNPINLEFPDTIEEMKVKKEAHAQEQLRLLDLIEKESFSCYLLAQQLRLSVYMEMNLNQRIIIAKLWKKGKNNTDAAMVLGSHY